MLCGRRAAFFLVCCMCYMCACLHALDITCNVVQVVPLKLLQKAPRGSTAKSHHSLKSSSKLVYADQVQVRGCRGLRV